MYLKKIYSGIYIYELKKKVWCDNNKKLSCPHCIYIEI